MSTNPSSKGTKKNILSLYVAISLMAITFSAAAQQGIMVDEESLAEVYAEKPYSP